MLSQGAYGLAKGGLGNILKNDNMSSHSTGNTRSAISAGAITLTNDAAQQTLTGQTAAQTIASLSRDTTTAHTAAQKQDVEGMKQDMATERLIEGEAFKQATVTADESYKTMFTKNHALYEVTKNPDGTLKAKEVNGTDSLKTGEDGKVHLSTNGIFNDTGAATKYTGQHATDPGTQYLIAFPEANSPVAELFVAGYQKFLESDALGLTNSTTQVVDIMNQYGQSGLAINGHSRGSLTVGNAMDSLANQQNAAGRLNGTNINFFGPAKDVNNANATLSSLQNQKTMTADQQNNSVLRYMCHVADPVCGIVGRNDPTGGTIPRGNGTTVDWSADGSGGSVSPGSTSLVWERLRAATGRENTSHNLYFVDQVNLQPGVSNQERGRLLNDFWRSGNPTLQPANR